jgi:hypothetical protein
MSHRLIGKGGSDECHTMSESIQWLDAAEPGSAVKLARPGDLSKCRAARRKQD